MTTYLQKQFSKLQASQLYIMQIQGDGGSRTTWLNVTPAQLKAIQNILEPVRKFRLLEDLYAVSPNWDSSYCIFTKEQIDEHVYISHEKGKVFELHGQDFVDPEGGWELEYEQYKHQCVFHPDKSAGIS